jgi:hypothetical protein
MRWLQEQIGDRSITGKQAAMYLARITDDETPEQAQRRQLIEGLTSCAKQEKPIKGF